MLALNYMRFSTPKTNSDKVVSASRLSAGVDLREQLHASNQFLLNSHAKLLAIAMVEFVNLPSIQILSSVISDFTFFKFVLSLLIFILHHLLRVTIFLAVMNSVCTLWSPRERLERRGHIMKFLASRTQNEVFGLVLKL